MSPDSFLFTKFFKCHFAFVFLTLFVRQFANSSKNRIFVLHLKVLIFSAKVPGSTGGTIRTIIVAVRARRREEFFSCFPVFLLLKVKSLGYFEFFYPNWQENDIMVKGDTIVLPKIFRVPFRFGWIYFLVR